MGDGVEAGVLAPHGGNVENRVAGKDLGSEVIVD